MNLNARPNRDGRTQPSIQQSTVFNFSPGLAGTPASPPTEIDQYEKAVGARFPNDLRAFLLCMNGTDLPTLNIYGSSGHPPRHSIGLYSYPRDLEIVKSKISDLTAGRSGLRKTLSEQGFDLEEQSALVPFYAHRFVACAANPEDSVVLSIMDSEDAIVYGNSLKEYLEREFLA